MLCLRLEVGKLLKILKKIANGEEPKIPPTIEDVSVIEKIKEKLKEKIY